MRCETFVRSLLLAATLFGLCAAPATLRAEDQPPQPTNETNEQELDQSQAPDFGPQTEHATFEAARRYADIAERGGWPRLARPLKAGAKGAEVEKLRRRLATEGYLDEDASRDATWGDSLTDAVKRFQANHGLDQTGDLSRATLRELNVPAATRAKALQATARRLSHLHFKFPPRYIEVNIAGESVESVENGRVAGRFTAIVGGKKHKSPQIVAKIVSVDLNPAWTVPASIIKKELVPRLRRDPAYLSREHIRVFDARGREIDPKRLRHLSAARAARFTFRQDPGPKNALGSLRLTMPNRDEVYMHDTPQKKLFDRDFRFLSHGCVRVEGVYVLAAWVLHGDLSTKWSSERLESETATGRTEKIRLKRPLPVVWAYMTGWSEGDGPARFRRDTYGLDKGTRLPRAEERPVAQRGA